MLRTHTYKTCTFDVSLSKQTQEVNKPVLKNCVRNSYRKLIQIKSISCVLNLKILTTMTECSTDAFRFNEEKLFRVIRDCLPDDLLNTQNLISVFDDILFAWNSKNCCVLTLNWRLNRIKEPNSVAYQVRLSLFLCVPSKKRPGTFEVMLMFCRSFYVFQLCLWTCGE